MPCNCQRRTFPCRCACRPPSCATWRRGYWSVSGRSHGVWLRSRAEGAAGMNLVFDEVCHLCARVHAPVHAPVQVANVQSLQTMTPKEEKDTHKRCPPFHPLSEMIMRIARRLLAVPLSATLFAAHTVGAQPEDAQLSIVLRGGNSANGYLKIEGIDGESIMSPRDPASGLPTGRRTHKPIAARTAIGVLEEFQVIVATAPTAKTSNVFVTLSMEGGGTCKARVPATYDASAKRIDVAIGDGARFFDAAKRPRADLCPTR
jgi:hypothetical protein